MQMGRQSAVGPRRHNLRREERLARLRAALIGKHDQGGGPGGQLGLPVWQQRRWRHDQPRPVLATRLSQVREKRYGLPGALTAMRALLVRIVLVRAG